MLRSLLALGVLVPALATTAAGVEAVATPPSPQRELTRQALVAAAEKLAELVGRPWDLLLTRGLQAEFDRLRADGPAWPEQATITVPRPNGMPGAGPLGVRYVAPVNAPADAPLAVLDPQTFARHRTLLLGRDRNVVVVRGEAAVAAWSAAADPDPALAWAKWRRQQPPWRTPLMTLEPDNLVVLEAPPGLHHKAKDTHDNAAIDVFFSDADGNHCCAIVAEAGSIGDDRLATRQLARQQRAWLEKAGTGLRLLGEWPVTIDGVPGLRTRSAVTINDQPLLFDQVAVGRNGFLLQISSCALATGDPQGNRLTADAEAMHLRIGFIDRDRRSPALPSPAAMVAEVDSAAHGYRLHLGPGWQALSQAKRRNTLLDAEFIGDGGAALAIAVAELGPEPVDPRDVHAALLAFLDIPFPDHHHQGIHPTPGGITSIYVDATDADRAEAVLRSVRSGDRAYLIAAWRGRDAAIERADLEQRVAGFTVADDHPQTPLPRPAFFANQLGLAAQRENRFDQALARFVRADELDGGNRIYLLNCLLAWCRCQRWSDGLEWFERRAGAYANDPEVAAYRAFFLGELGRVDDAAVAWATVFAAGHIDAADFRAYVYLLWNHGRRSEALAAFAACPRLGQSPAGCRLQAELRTDAGEHEAAITLLRDLAGRQGRDESTLLALSRALGSAGRWQEADEALTPLLADSSGSAAAWRRRAICAFQLQWYPQARAAVVRALELDAGAQDLVDLQRRIDNAMGKGDRQALATVIEAVPLPAGTPMPDPAATQPETTTYLLRACAQRWRKDEGLTSTYYRTVAIVDQPAVENFTSFAFGIAPGSESLYINRLEVRDHQGALVGELRREDCYVLHEDQGKATSRWTAHVPVPGLRPGCTLTLVATLRDRGCVERPPFVASWLSADRPVAHALVTMAGDDAEIACVAGGGLEPRRHDGQLVVEAWALPAQRQEPMAVPAATQEAIAWFGDARADWATLGREYLASIGPRLTTPPLVAETAADAVAAINEPDRRIRALAAVVQRRLSYQALEFGKRARMPEPAEQVLANGYGDCKDHALLLQRLLTAAGITAHLALVDSARGLRRELPDLDQFDHLVVAVPRAAGWWFIDTTGKDGDPAPTVPESLSGCAALVLDPAAPVLTSIPPPAMDVGGLVSERSVRIASDGSLRVRERLVANGCAAASFRSAVCGVPRDQLRDRVGKWSTAFGTLESVDLSGVDDPLAPLGMVLVYRPEARLTPLDGRLVGHLPALFERDWLILQALSERRRDIVVRLPLTLTSRIRWEPPAGWSVRARTPVPGDDLSWLDYHEQGVAGGIDVEVCEHAGERPVAQWEAMVERSATVVKRLEVEVVAIPPDSAHPGEAIVPR